MKHVSRTFAALSDPVRLNLVEHLMQAGEAPAGDLVALTEISAPAVSRHLKVLREAGVLVQRVQGTHRYYRVAPESLAGLDDWLSHHRAFWQASLARLDTLLEEDEDAG